LVVAVCLGLAKLKFEYDESMTFFNRSHTSPAGCAGQVGLPEPSTIGAPVPGFTHSHVWADVLMGCEVAVPPLLAS
jgi:hypothetical protein